MELSIVNGMAFGQGATINTTFLPRLNSDTQNNIFSLHTYNTVITKLMYFEPKDSQAVEE